MGRGLCSGVGTTGTGERSALLWCGGESASTGAGEGSGSWFIRDEDGI